MDHADKGLECRLELFRNQIRRTVVSGMRNYHLHKNMNSLGASAAWFNAAALAFNLHTILKLNCLPEKHHKSRPRTLRFELYTMAGKVVCHGRRIILKLWKGDHGGRLLAGALTKLEMLPEPDSCYSFPKPSHSIHEYGDYVSVLMSVYPQYEGAAGNPQKHRKLIPKSEGMEQCASFATLSGCSKMKPVDLGLLNTQRITC
jgi:hypothetical protein